MTDTMQKVEMGDLSQRFSPQAANSQRKTFPGLKALMHLLDIKREWFRDNEVQQLGKFFNRMMHSLQSNWEQNQQLQKSLEEKEQIRVELLKKMINIQEDERKRIARELHDETSQSLTSLLLMLKTVQQTNDVKSIQNLPPLHGM
jgi:signal transduction histidine kinase